MSELPASWALTKLGDVCEVVSGSTPRTTVPDYWGGEIAWITPDDLSGYSRKTIAKGARNITEDGYDSCSTRLVPAGTVLFTSRAPIGYVAIASQPLCTNQGFKSFIPNEALTSDFLYWFLKHATPAIRELGSGTTFPELSQARAKEVAIPVAPVAEQRRIVAVIEEQSSRLDAAEAAIRTAKRRLDRISAAILSAAFREIQEACRLADIADVRLGRQRSPKNHTGPNMRPYLRAANVTWTGLDLSDVKSMNFSPTEVSTYELVAGDVLLSEASGSADEVGKPAIWADEIPGCCFQNTLIRVRARDVLPEYLHKVFLREALTGKFARAAPGVGIHHLGSTRLSAWPIPIVPLDQQAHIVAEVERQLSIADAMTSKVGRALRRTAALRRAILERAFSGKLVPQDPSDEPASVLLERIAAERSAARKPSRRKGKIPA